MITSAERYGTIQLLTVVAALSVRLVCNFRPKCSNRHYVAKKQQSFWWQFGTAANKRLWSSLHHRFLLAWPVTTARNRSVSSLTSPHIPPDTPQTHFGNSDDRLANHNASRDSTRSSSSARRRASSVGPDHRALLQSLVHSRRNPVRLLVALVGHRDMSFDRSNSSWNFVSIAEITSADNSTMLPPPRLSES
jgi:hypothetical protein